jgi:hypothetical protein
LTEDSEDQFQLKIFRAIDKMNTTNSSSAVLIQADVAAPQQAATSTTKHHMKMVMMMMTSKCHLYGSATNRSNMHVSMHDWAKVHLSDTFACFEACSIAFSSVMLADERFAN